MQFTIVDSQAKRPKVFRLVWMKAVEDVKANLLTNLGPVNVLPSVL
jgi:hypothetical protein